MKRVMWGGTATILALSAGCPDASRDCGPGSYYNEALRSCLVDCRDLSNPGCRDSGIGSDAMFDATPDAALQCSGGQIACDGRCVDPTTDSNHCGRCGVRCASPDGGTATCNAGACQLNCGAATHVCNGACVPDDSVASCGTRCDPCPAPTGARATCTAGACGVECLPGFERNGMGCDVVAPRPVFPPVTSTVTSLRPTLRWSLPVGVDGARVQVCRDRACSMVVATLDATGASARPTADLPTSSVLFWRIAGRAGATAGERFSATWQFRTRATNTPIDTAHGVDLDVNGDGFSDAAVFSRVGRVNIHHGGAAGVGSAAAATIGSTRIATFLVPTRVVGSAGDIDGDGFADVVVGYPTEIVSGMVGAGCVRWFRGGAAGVASAASATFCASEASASVGIAVAGIGDVNGDGFADVAVGASGATSMGTRTAGSVLLFLGSSSGWPAIPSRTLSGTIAAENMGSAVSPAVDVNGDQFSDLIIGHGGGGAAGAGIVTVWRGSSTGVGPASSLTVEGVANGDYFGSALAGGDFNGDGFGDVVIGAQAGPTTSVGGNAGSASVLFGSMTGLQIASPTTLRATQDTSNFGHTIVNAGDTNRDGFDDVLVGAPTARPGGLSNAGTAFLFRGAAAMSTSATQTMPGTSMQDNFGIAVGGGGDFNRDGFSDVIVGSSNASPMSRAQAGTATIFTGGAAALTMSTTLEGAAAMDGFGAGVASWVPSRTRTVYHRRACVAPR